MARQFDPKHERTLEIISKCDVFSSEQIKETVKQNILIEEA
jgi:hypothetical protein